MISFDGFSAENNVPIYLQIISYIKRGIVSGVIADGDEMPSRRTLSALLGVNPNTVQKSYAMLEEQGLVHSRAGAKSCVRVSRETVAALREELLAESLQSMARAMKQMGMTKEEALAALGKFWEVTE